MSVATQRFFFFLHFFLALDARFFFFFFLHFFFFGVAAEDVVEVEAGVGPGGAGTWTSKAPMSQAGPDGREKPGPR